MSEIEGGGGGEVSSSSEVSETSVAETGGESSEATQEATTEEVGESGGFDEDADTTESPEDSAEDYEESDSDEEPDDSQEVGFSEGDDVENADSQYDGSDYENDDTSSGDEDGVGFDDSDDDINEEIGADTDSDTYSSDSPMDEDNDESFDEPNDYEDETSESDWDDQEDEDLGELEDYSDEESLDDSTEDGDDINDAQDDGEAQNEDTESTADGDEADDDMDNDGEPDDAETDTEYGDNIDDAQYDGEAQNEDTDSDADGDEADGDMDNDGEPDDAEADTEDGDNLDDNWDDQEDEDLGEPEDYSDEESLDDSTEDGDDINDAQYDGEAQNEDTESTADGDEADDDMDNDGEPDDAETNTEDDDYDEDEDPGELEDYSDEDTDNRDDETTDDSESEHDNKEEEQAVEENEEAADRAENETENADVENADKNVDDAAEFENKNPAENGIEPQTESTDANSTNEVDAENDASRTGENNNDEAHADTSDNKEDNSTDTRDQTEEQPDDTNVKMYNKADTPESEDAYRTTMNNMAEYMSKHNYGPDDYSEYSQDPEWQKLNADLQQSLGMEVTTDMSTPSQESGKNVSATELPDNCVMVNTSDIDMTYAQGMYSDQFWNHHGNTKEDYMRMAERIPDVQQALDSGKSLDEIKQDPELKDTAHAYFGQKNMVKVEQQADGSYSFAGDGRHRIAAAQELGYEIPVEVTNLPENVNASTADRTDIKPEDTTLPEDVANKSDISDETRENLGAFEQNKWDNLSQVEKEQALEKLRDSIAEDLQLENKPNIAYYNNEGPGDYGGYAASNNTIYINRFNMGDAAETADTIAHESRHCWQHERADNPQTEQDYQFKENFDDYVRPEDDFYEYQNQPVEADARDYAQDVKDAIPVSEETPDMDAKRTHEESDHKNNSDAPPSTTGPPEKTYQKSELPADFENKNGYQPLNEQAEQKCQLAGMEKDQVQKIREIPNGKKPNPEDYLSKDTIESHLKKFEDEGCYKVIPGEPVGTVGKGDSLFVCRGSELEQALVEADGDPRKLEKALGMDEGYLGDNPYIVRVDNPKDLRMATGNETNAWQDYWCPGGTTIGGMDEAVVTPPNSDDYSFKPCFENGISTSIYDENWKKH